MKKILFSAFIFFGSFSGGLHAQEFNFGVNFNFMPLSAMGPINNGNSEYPDYGTEEINTLIINYQANIGFDYQPITFNNDKMSIGVNSNFAIGNLISPFYEGINSAITIDFPQYIAFRYGNRSTIDNYEGFGLGLGIGYNYQLIPFFLQGSPNMFIDITFDSGWFVKLSYDLSKNYLYNYHSSEGYVPVIEYRQIGFQIGYTI